jgi:hypothetical protein
MAETPAGSANTSPPCLPRPSSPSEPGFVRRPMVRWLDPHQLVDTAVRVPLSGIFSSYADSRVWQVLEPADVPDRSGEADLWLDYVADLGDGWNSTYTVARLLATEELKLDWDGETYSTERGQILVMGGDQVCPVPNATEYENRMLGPYRAALPCVAGEAPELFAIPGSHDRYDGWSTSPASSAATTGSANGEPASAGATSRSSSRTAGAAWGPHHPVHGQGGRERPETGRDPFRPGCGIPRTRDHPAQWRPAVAVPQECRSVRHDPRVVGVHAGTASRRPPRLGLGELRHAVWESPTSFLLIPLMAVSLAGTVCFAHDARGVGQFCTSRPTVP